MFNCFPDLNDLKKLSKFYELVKNTNFHKNSENEDNFVAIYKWAIILYVFENFIKDKKNLKILDVGGGYYSWLTNYFTKYGEVTNIDIIDTYKENGKLNSNKVYYNSKINFINGNFLKVGKKLSNNYYDFIYDGCAIIHFNPTKKNNLLNYGVYETAAIINNILSDKGIFISSSHCVHPNYYQVRDMIYPENLMNSYLKAGLNPLFKPDFKINEYFNIDNKYFNPFTKKNFNEIISNFESNKKFDLLFERGNMRDETMLMTLNFLFSKGDFVKNNNYQNFNNNFKQKLMHLVFKIKRKFRK